MAPWWHLKGLIPWPAHARPGQVSCYRLKTFLRSSPNLLVYDSVCELDHQRQELLLIGRKISKCWYFMCQQGTYSAYGTVRIIGYARNH